MNQPIRTDWPSYYEFRIKGYLSAQRYPWLAQMSITALPNGETLLVGLLEDQAALYGFLSRIRDLGVLLLSVNRRQEAGEQCQS